MTKDSRHIKAEFNHLRIARSSDKRNWIIQELRGENGINKRTKEPSKPYWWDVAYFGKLEHVVHALLSREIEVPDDSMDTQLKAILEEIKKAESRILEQLKVIE